MIYRNEIKNSCLSVKRSTHQTENTFGFPADGARSWADVLFCGVCVSFTNIDLFFAVIFQNASESK